jgi:hypothetical protein
MSATARTVDSLTPPSDAGDDVQFLAEYGVGIDCHSRFVQVCVPVTLGSETKRFEREFRTTPCSASGVQR